VLHYSALQTGVAYVALTLAVIVFANVSQAVALRLGVRRVLPFGLLLAGAGLLLYARLPVNGHYFWDLFPAFLLTGIGMAFAFVPMTIGALAGVRPADAGIASGLINTTQQIGGAVGVAAATTISSTYTSHFVGSHAGASPLGGPALVHGFEIAFYVLAAVTIAAALITAIVVESQPAHAEEAEPVEAEPVFELPCSCNAAEPAEPVLSAFSLACSFFFASSDCDSPNFSSASLELCEARKASTIDVAMKTVAATAVIFCRNDEAPEPPNTVAALPPPPKAPPMPPPLPCWRRIVRHRNRHTSTCTIVSNEDMEEAGF